MTASGAGDRPSPTWALALSAGALVASAAHVAIDFAADVYPANPVGVTLVAVPATALYVLWAVTLARVSNRDPSAGRAARLLALWQAALGNGLAALFPCPPTVLVGGPPSCALAPWQDLVHVGSLILGAAAFVALRHLHEDVPDNRHLTRLAVAVLAVHLTLAAVVAVT